ncbi:hypothetical protein C8R45DRAFT_939920 [Mycena sanguinolenta]|nr:hypothetical protein C8R45DRAFT_939920 [Mycena sanguinolenta]
MSPLLRSHLRGAAGASTAHTTSIAPTSTMHLEASPARQKHCASFLQLTSIARVDGKQERNGHNDERPSVVSHVILARVQSARGCRRIGVMEIQSVFLPSTGRISKTLCTRTLTRGGGVQHSQLKSNTPRDGPRSKLRVPANYQQADTDGEKGRANEASARTILVEVKEVQYEMYTRLPGRNADSGSLKEVWRRTVILRGTCAHPEPERHASDNSRQNTDASSSSSPSPPPSRASSLHGLTAHPHRLHGSAPRPDPDIAREAEVLGLGGRNGKRYGRRGCAVTGTVHAPLEGFNHTAAAAAESIENDELDVAPRPCGWRSEVGSARCGRSRRRRSETDGRSCESQCAASERRARVPTPSNVSVRMASARNETAALHPRRMRNAVVRWGAKTGGLLDRDREAATQMRRAEEVSALRLDPHCEGGRARARRWKRHDDEDEVLCSARGPVPRRLHPLSVTHLVDAVRAPSLSRLEVSPSYGTWRAVLAAPRASARQMVRRPRAPSVCVRNLHVGKYAEGQGGAESEGRIGGREVSVSAARQGESSTLLGDEEGHILNCIGEVNRPRPGGCDLTRWTLSSSPIAIQRASPSPIRRAENPRRGHTSISSGTKRMIRRDPRPSSIRVARSFVAPQPRWHPPHGAHNSRDAVPHGRRLGTLRSRKKTEVARSGKPEKRRRPDFVGAGPCFACNVGAASSSAEPIELLVNQDG